MTADLLHIGPNKTSQYAPHHVVGIYIDKEDGSRIAEVFVNCGSNERTARARAEFIVRCVNAHEDLVTELSAALCFVEDAEDCSDFKTGVVKARLKSIHAALVQAGAA